MWSAEDLALLDQLNATEMVALLQFNEVPGFHADGPTKSYPREYLKQLLMNLDPPEEEPALTLERKRINKFVTARWERFRSQAPYKQCPECTDGRWDPVAKKLRRCSDLQVMFCWMKNEDLIP